MESRVRPLVGPARLAARRRRITDARSRAFAFHFSVFHANHTQRRTAPRNPRNGGLGRPEPAMVDSQGDGEVDLETLQAQIDMSMAFTHNLVAGWMKSSPAKLPSSASRAKDDMELEEYMRRPPRYVPSLAPARSPPTHR